MLNPAIVRLSCRDVLSAADLSPEDVVMVFATAARIKADITPVRRALDGSAVALLFEKPSLRTRVSFEVGVALLGGIPITLDHGSQRLGEREAVKDYARNLERWVRCIVARTYSHTTLRELARHADIPIVNALSDLEHPCQALADFFTLRERLGDLRRVNLAYIGDGNNVCHSLMLIAALTGAGITIITPEGHAPSDAITAMAHQIAARTDGRVVCTHDLSMAASHHAVYTDAWVSMGQADDDGRRRRALERYQVNREVMSLASRGLAHSALFMHCLPATRGQEVTDEVMDAPHSVVYDQAENRMHVQNALLLHLLVAGNA